MAETEVETKGQGGRPPKYLEPILRRIDDLDAKVRISAGEGGTNGLVPPGVLFKDLMCAWVASGRINPADPTIANALSNNAAEIWDSYVRVTKAANAVLKG